MRKIFLTTLMVALALPAAAVEWATTIKSIEVVPGIYILQGANGFSSNMCLLVGDEHVLLIDDGVAAITDSLMAKVQELAGRPVDFLSRRQADRRPRSAPAADLPIGRQDADNRRVRVPAQRGYALHAAGQRALLHREPTEYDVPDDRAEVQTESGVGEGAG